MHLLARSGGDRRGPQPQLRPVSGAAPAPTATAHADLPRPRAVLRARVAQHPVARLPQPGDDAHHQPHDRRARPARPGPDGRSATRSTRSAATRPSATRWRLETATSARRASSCTTPPGTTEDWSYNATGGFGSAFEIYCGAPNYEDRRLRRRRVPSALRDDGEGVGRHEPAGRPRRRSRLRHRDAVRDAARPTTARGTARRTTSPPRARSTRPATASSRAALRPVPGSRSPRTSRPTPSRPPSRSTTTWRPCSTSALRARSAGT